MFKHYSNRIVSRTGKKSCQFGRLTFVFTVVSAIHSYILNVLDLFGNVKDYIDLRVGFSWTYASCCEIYRDLDGYVAMTNDRFKKLFDKPMNVVAQFKYLKADLKTNTKFQLGRPNARRPLL